MAGQRETPRHALAKAVAQAVPSSAGPHTAAAEWPRRNGRGGMAGRGMAAAGGWPRRNGRS
jgi:hypothetical protein